MGIALGFLAACISISAVPAADDDNLKISIQVPPGAPLRVYLTRRLPKRLGAPVEAKVMEPVFAFDREVVPAGTVAQGTVSRVRPAGRWQRVRAILNGDFTPLRSAEVEFTSLTLPDGRTLATHTVQAPAMNSIYTEPPKNPKNPKRQKSQPQNQNGGILGTVKQTAKDQVNGAINARTRGIADIVRAPNKKEKLVDLFWSKLPYHPQYYRRGTRFDAPLRDSLEFGFASIRQVDIAAPGSQPRPDSVVRVRLLTALDSASAKPGEPVQAVVAAPLFSPEHKLVLPEGTQLTGIVVLARKARSFHRAGQLRFNFQKMDLPPELANLRPAAPMQTQASVAAAEGNGTTPIKVDTEGGVQAQESKTRFIAPVISLMLASRAADNDAGHHHDTGPSGDPNISGRTLGGGLGFGMLGSALAQSSRYVGMAFGYYGLAWSVYSAVVARGGEVQFDKNAMMDIKFGARAPREASKLREVASGLPALRPPSR
jgi:hypothetical protein